MSFHKRRRKANPTLADEELELALELLQKTVIENLYIPDDHKPHEVQAVFLTVPLLEVMYGGAGGGGKSAALLMAALQYVHEPGYNAMLFRNSFADLNLSDGLIPMSHEWLRGTDAKWLDRDHSWLFPTGSRLSFGYMESDADRWRYKSAQFQFIGFDELTSFSKIQYLFMFSRLRRRMHMHVPLRMRSATNPGGQGHEWVKKRFIGIKGFPVNHPDRLYIRATMDDNPHLDRDEYKKSLAHLPPLERAQIQHGDWEVRPEGEQFKREWFTDKFVDRIPCPIVKAVRYWDLASTAKSVKKKKEPDFTAGVLVCKGEDKNYYITDVRRTQATPGKIEKLVKRTAEYDGYDVWIGMEEEGGSSGKIVSHHYRQVLEGFVFRPVRPSGDKVKRSDPLASASEGGMIYIVRGDWNDDFLDELCSFDGMTGHDDQVDSVVGAFTLMTRTVRRWTSDQWKRVFDRHTHSKPIDRQTLLQMKLRGKYKTPVEYLYPERYMNSN